MNHWLCYCPALPRPRRTLVPGDVPATLKRYQDEEGRPARVMRLNPAFKSWAVPDGVDVHYWPGVSLWEIDLADAVPIPQGVES